MKKGQGISLNTIVIAVIALVVLAVIVGIFTVYISNAGDEFGTYQEGELCKGTDLSMERGFSCSNKGDDWNVVFLKLKNCEDDDDPIDVGCKKTGYVCCKRG